jgi:predicted nucleotidyltransferase component of viral defense system
MKLHESPDLFKQAITITAQQMNIPPEYVEKDYWVTFALKRIFQSPINEEVVFKGGTALSKCYGLIERFSEDIDLVILRKSGESDNKMKQKLKVPAESIRPLSCQRLRFLL